MQEKTRLRIVQTLIVLMIAGFGLVTIISVSIMDPPMIDEMVAYTAGGIILVVSTLALLALTYLMKPGEIREMLRRLFPAFFDD